MIDLGPDDAPAPLPRGAYFGDVVDRWPTEPVTAVKVAYPRDRGTPEHSHACAYLTYVVDGDYEEQSGVGRETRRAGSLVLHGAGERHSQRSGARGVVAFHVELPELSDWIPALAVERPMTLTGAILEALVRRALRRLPDRGEGRDSSLPAPLGLALALAAVTQARDSGAPRWLVDARELLCGGATGTRRIAGRVGVHASHLSTRWKREYGMTVGNAERLLRVARAVELLEDERLGLAQVAQLAGFADQPHLTREFRRWTGETPGAWRRAP